MSYCRFLECDVYAYDSVDGGVQFYVSEGRRDLDRLCPTYNEAYQYAKALRDEHGLDVPDHAIEELRADAIGEVERTTGAGGVFAELQAENARLRELVREVLSMNENPEVFWEYENPHDFWHGWCCRARELGVEADDG